MFTKSYDDKFIDSPHFIYEHRQFYVGLAMGDTPGIWILQDGTYLRIYPRMAPGVDYSLPKDIEIACIAWIRLGYDMDIHEFLEKTLNTDSPC